MFLQKTSTYKNFLCLNIHIILRMSCSHRIYLGYLTLNFSLFVYETMNIFTSQTSKYFLSTFLNRFNINLVKCKEVSVCNKG